MRYSSTSVEQFHLGRLVDGIDRGKIGIPEFQRDFDWNENDIRSLLATVFAGWPAGSLLLLEGESKLFKMRAIETAPPLSKVLYGVLDGQQRLTSLYQALFGKGDSIFGVKWDAPADQEIEESIVSIRRRQWERSYATLEQQVQHRIMPIEALKSPTEFFTWRDKILSTIADNDKRELLRENITNLYTYRLSAVHDYEFPVVKIDREVEPSAISRIFEKVNKTGLTLNTFDLVVAKSFDPHWNLRDKWLMAREEYPNLSGFFGEDGLPLLQAISLLRKDDLRQSSVLDLSKHDVQKNWQMVSEAASRVVAYLRGECGVLRRDFMPYINLLPAFIALETKERISVDNSIFDEWFWNSGFTGAYDAAANTRLSSHYRSVRDGNRRGFEIEDEFRVIFLSGATKKSQKALWTVVNCSYVVEMEQRGGRRLSEEMIAELDISTLFSFEEISKATNVDDFEDIDSEYRGCLNSLLVPRRIAGVTKKVGASESVEFCRHTEFGEYTIEQFGKIQGGCLKDWKSFRAARARQVLDFMRARKVSDAQIVISSPDAATAEIVQL